MKRALLIVVAAALLTGCWQGSSDPADETPGDVSISKYAPPLEAEIENEDDVFVAVDSDGDDSSDGERFHIIIDYAPLLQVVREIALASGENIILVPAQLRGRVTANLEDVDAMSALESILDMHNYDLLESPPGSGIYRIDEHVPGAPEPMKVRVYSVESGEEANEIASALKEALGGSGARIAAVPSREAIIVTATQSDHYLVEDIMDKLNEDQE
jgi:type II secretory pathway component GspD/PulD (secretin)